MLRLSTRVQWAAACLVLAACGDSQGDPAQESGTDSSGTTGDTPSPADDESETGTDEGAADESTDTSGTTGGPMVDPGDPYDEPPPLPPLPDETVAQLADDIDAALANPSVAGTTQSVLIIDAETGQQLYAKNPDLLLKPASNTKLLTTAGAMEMLGPDYRMLTDVRADAPPDASGNVAGDLHLVMHHDFTWSPRFWGPADFSLDLIAADLYAQGLRSVDGALVVHGEAVYDGAALAYYNADAHRTTAANVFASSLANEGIAVAGGTTTVADFAEPGQSLYTWRSPPLSVGCTPTNSSSHNEFADVLMRHIGYAVDGDGSYEGGTQAVIGWLGSLPTPTEGIELNDGSGLSHDNRLSARTVVDTFVSMLGSPAGLPWRQTLSTSGVRGTLAGRLATADTWGRVWGKTGTLTGVIATSGVAFNRHDGRRYIVSILMNEVASNASARSVQDDVFEIIARDHFGTERPEAPTLTHVLAAESDAVEIAWSSSEGADAYLVWLSGDGRVWDRDDARLVTGQSHRAGLLPHGPDVFVRVTAVGEGGESDPSDVYGARSEEGTAQVLIVDGFDRWQAEPLADNPLQANHDFAVAHALALSGAAIWDSTTNEAVASGDIDLAQYDAVLWLLGEESTEHETFDAIEQERIADYLDAGGHLFVSGAEIGWDLVANGDPADAAFFSDVLRAGYIGDDAATWAVVGSGGAAADLSLSGFFTPATLVAEFADELAPGRDAVAIIDYVGGFGGTAAVASEQVVLLGFPFETLDNPQSQAELMAGVLEAFGLPE